MYCEIYDYYWFIFQTGIIEYTRIEYVILTLKSGSKLKGVLRYVEYECIIHLQYYSTIHMDFH